MEKEPEGSMSASDLLLNCQEMIFHIINHVSGGAADEKDSQ